MQGRMESTESFKEEAGGRETGKDFLPDWNGFVKGELHILAGIQLLRHEKPF